MLKVRLMYLKYNKFPAKKVSFAKEFVSIQPPDISSTPIYSVQELFNLAAIVEYFNCSTIVKAKWSYETGILEFITIDNTIFWFVAKNDTCQNLADLTFFQDTKYRATLLIDGRIALTGWCEGWLYGTIADTLMLKN